MRSFAATVALALFFTSVHGSPSPLVPIQKFAGRINPNSFIIKLKSNTDKTVHLETLKPHLEGSDSQVIHDYDSDFFNGFSGTFSQDTLNILQASPDVEYIEEDGIAHILETTTQTDAPWNLARLSQNDKISGTVNSTNFTYNYDSSAGSGVDIYILDTGIFLEHSDFGGRARLGAVFGGFPPSDGHGHGTHVAGTAAGTRWGVAKAANLIAVKVVSDEGRGSVSNAVAGLNFVAKSSSASGRPSVVNLSLATRNPSPTLDRACASLIKAGVHVVAGAGNDNVDARNTSPARAPGVNTVGASTILDTRAKFSNYGAVLDIFAPGENIRSAGISSPTSSTRMAGTSMAAPHVAGLIAYLIALNGNVSPADMTNKLHTLGTDGILTGLSAGTRNELARNDISA